jgi:hypothetical protein
MALSAIKPVIWIGSTRADLSAFPEEVKDAIGYALYVAQQGGKHPMRNPCEGSAEPAFWRSSRTMLATHIAPFTRFDWPGASTLCTHSRRNQRLQSRRQNLKLI